MEDVVITEKRKKGTKILYVAVFVVLILMFVVGFIIGLNRVLAMEGQFKPVVLEEGLYPAPENEREAVDLLNRSVEKALADKPKVRLSDDFSVNKDSVTTTIGDKAEDTFSFITDAFEDTLDESFDGHETDFGEDFASFFNSPGIYEDDIDDFTCEYFYYECANCAERSDAPLDVCEACNYPYPYALHYNDDYSVSFNLKETGDVLNGNYAPRTEEEAIRLFGAELEGVCSVDSVSTEYKDLRMSYGVRRVTDELTRLSYAKDMTVTLELTFEGAYTALGSGTVTFDITESTNYDFTWPGLSLDKHEVTIEPKATDNCLATLTCTDPLAPVVTWTSSDESLLTVDEDGYFKATKNTGEATVTASFEFNGKTYSDECAVHVRIPVESSRISERKLSLSPGQTHELNVTVGPKDATIKTVTWYTENESVAVVDENGVVTAIAPGTAAVYSLSDDGYYRSSCEVTVNE